MATRRAAAFDPSKKKLGPEKLWPTEFWAFRLLGTTDEGTVSCGFLGKPCGREVVAARTSFSAVVCLAGEGWLHTAHGKDRVSPRQVFLRLCHQPHALEITTAPWRECWISLGSPVERLWRAAGVINEHLVRPVAIDEAWLDELLAVTTALQSAPDFDLPHHLLHLQGMVLALLQTRSTCPNETLDLAKACALLAQPAPSLKIIARRCGLGYDPFRREFTRRTGIAPGAWRVARLIERARLVLHATTRPIGDIASELGYANPFAFSAAFRRATGSSPRAWRQRRDVHSKETDSHADHRQRH